MDQHHSRLVLALGMLLVLAGNRGALPATAQEATPAASPAALGPVEFVGEIGGDPFGGFGEVAVAPDGTVWVVGDPNTIHIFDLSGVLRESWGTPGAGPGQFDFSSYGGAVGFDGEGNVYVLESGNLRVEKFDRDRNLVLAWGSFGTGDGQFVGPTDIAVAPDGTVYVADTERRDVQKFAPDGTFLTKVSPTGPAGGFDGVARIGIDPHGNLYVPDVTRVHKFAPDGTLLLTFGSEGTGDGQFLAPIDAAADAAGTVYVSDAATNRVQAFDAEGRFLAGWGGEGTASGQFREPDALALDGAGNIYVLDFGNQRVQKFRLLPPLAPTEIGTPTP
jgi:tripartite motif-containing protein 71